MRAGCPADLAFRALLGRACSRAQSPAFEADWAAPLLGSPLRKDLARLLRAMALKALEVRMRVRLLQAFLDAWELKAPSPWLVAAEQWGRWGRAFVYNPIHSTFHKVKFLRSASARRCRGTCI